MIIAIDGPSASGKSTVAKLVAEKLSFQYIDTGAMYRAVAYACIKEEKDLDELELMLPDMNLSFVDKQIHLNGENIAKEIRMNEVSQHVSDVAALKAVRDKLVDEQRKMAQHGNVILDGRDIGTVVFPNAELKIFLIASAEVRAKRRLKDLEAQGETIDLETLVKEIELRDKKDSERAESPLLKADDAIELDTSAMTIEEVLKKITELALDKI